MIFSNVSFSCCFFSHEYLMLQRNYFRGFELLFCVKTSNFWHLFRLKQTNKSVILTQVLKTVIVWPVPSHVFSFTTFLTPFIIRDSKRECFQFIRELFPRRVKFHQPEKSKCSLLRLFLSMCRPCSMNDAGPLDFSGVYRLIWE